MKTRYVVMLFTVMWWVNVLANAAATDANRPGPQIETVEYVIIGAGTAGVFAANKLASQGKASVILEARNRIGGRIDTRFVNGYPHPIEMGPSFIHDASISPWPAIMAEAGYEMREWSDYEILFTNGNQKLSDVAGYEILTEFSGYWEAHFNYSQLGRSDREALFLAGYTERQPGIEAVLNAIMTEPAINLEYHDSTGWNPYPEEVLGLKYSLPGGYRQLLDYVFNNYTLATEGLRLRSEVRVIDYSNRDGSTTITYRDMEDRRTRYIKATKGVIITLPLGVLKAGSVTFTPPLSIPIQYSINKISCGQAMKVSLLFDWKVLPRLAKDKYNWYFRFPSDSSDGLSVIFNYGFIYGQPVLQSFFAGDYAAEMETKSDSEIVDINMRAIREFLPNLQSPVRHIISRWGSDEYTLCSYGDYFLGCTTDDFDRLLEPFGPENNLLFAGEHVGSFAFSPLLDQGTTNQAVTTSKWAAEYLLTLNAE